MSADKYPSIFSRQMKDIVYIITSHLTRVSNFDCPKSAGYVQFNY